MVIFFYSFKFFKFFYSIQHNSKKKGTRDIDANYSLGSVLPANK